jgi:hypothetical protein
MLERDGSLAWSVDYPPGAVKAIALAPAGMIAQLPDTVEIRTPTGMRSVLLPAGAVMTDFAEGTILYRLGNTAHFLYAATGKDALVLTGTAKTPLVATLDTHGFAWGRGTAANFACAGCILP